MAVLFKRFIFSVSHLSLEMEAERFTVDDLLDFTLDVYEEEDDDDETKTQKAPSPSSLESSNPNSHDPDEHGSLVSF